MCFFSQIGYVPLILNEFNKIIMFIILKTVYKEQHQNMEQKDKL